MAEITPVDNHALLEKFIKSKERRTKKQDKNNITNEVNSTESWMNPKRKIETITGT